MSFDRGMYTDQELKELDSLAEQINRLEKLIESGNGGVAMQAECGRLLLKAKAIIDPFDLEKFTDQN